MAVLSKLLKYDLRANLKIFLFIWPAILVFGLLERVALMAELPSKISAIFVNLTTVLFVLAVIAACVFALVISVIRFYSGLLLTTLIERITRKKLNPKYEAWINGVGMVLLLLLIAVITFKDIFHLFT